MDQWEREDNSTYRVVMDHEEQYSIWAEHKEIPAGWTGLIHFLLRLQRRANEFHAIGPYAKATNWSKRLK